MLQKLILVWVVLIPTRQHGVNSSTSNPLPRPSSRATPIGTGILMLSPKNLQPCERA